jgi:hypothetical protein
MTQNLGHGLDRNLVRQQAVKSGQQEAGEHHCAARAKRPELDNARAPTLVLRHDKVVRIHTKNLAHEAPWRSLT